MTCLDGGQCQLQASELALAQVPAILRRDMEGPIFLSLPALPLGLGLSEMPGILQTP